MTNDENKQENNLSAEEKAEEKNKASEPAADGLPAVADGIEEMFKAGAHFGYSRSSRNPKMKKFIFGLRNNVDVFDLEKTRKKLDEAKTFMESLGAGKKIVLFVSTKKGIAGLLEEYASQIGMPYVTERWLGGILTNFKAIKGRRDYMDELIQKRESGELAKYTKKEQLRIERKIARLKHYFAGLEALKTLPAALVIVDTKEERNAVREARNMKIPIIGVMNTDCNPDDAAYAVPANDNSMSSVGYLLGELAESYKKGLKEAEETAEKAAENAAKEETGDK